MIAAERVRDALRRADEGGYPAAWYMYVDRADVEVLVETAVGFERRGEALARAESALEVFARCCETGEDFPNQKAACTGGADCRGCSDDELPTLPAWRVAMIAEEADVRYPEAVDVLRAAGFTVPVRSLDS